MKLAVKNEIDSIPKRNYLFFGAEIRVNNKELRIIDIKAQIWFCHLHIDCIVILIERPDFRFAECINEIKFGI